MIAKSLLTASDFTMVRAALVRQLGSTDLAVILTRVAWRCEAQEDGWWEANHKQIANETGLSEDCVQRGLMKLRQAGHLVAEQRSGGYNRTMSYRVESGDVSDSSIPQNCGVDSAEVRNVLISKTTKTPVVDEVVNSPRSCERSQLDINREQQREKLRRPPRGKAKWVPHDTTIEEILDIATVMDAAEHLLHYRVRCSELGKKPNDTEWIRWFIRDQQNLVAANKLAASARESETSDDGTPLSWKN